MNLQKLFLLIFAITLVVAYTFQSRDYEVYDRSTSTAMLEKDLTLVNAEVDRLSDGQAPSFIETSIALYNIYRADSLILWNAAHTLRSVEDGAQFVILKNEMRGDLRALVYVDTLNPRNDYQVQLTSDEGDIYLSIKKDLKVKYWKYILALSYILLVLTLFTIISESQAGVNTFLLTTSALYITAITFNKLLNLDAIFNFPLLSSLSIIDWIICVAYLYVLSYGLEKYKFSISGKNYLIFFSGIIIAGLFIGFTLLVEAYLLQTPLFKLSTHSIQYSYQGLAFIILCLSSILGLFYFSSTLLKSIKHNHSADAKFYTLLFSGVALPFLGTLMLANFSTIPLFIFILIFLLILDLHIESRKKKIIFIFWWMLLLSAFLAGIIQKYTIKKDIKDRKAFAEMLYHTPEEYAIASLQSLNDSIFNSDIFLPLADIPQPIQLDRYDYIQYLEDKIKNWSGNDRFNISVYGFDHSDNPIFFNQFLSISEFQDLQKTSFSIDNQISFNNYSGEYLLTYEIENQYVKEPIKIYLSFDPKQRGIKSQSGFGYIIFQDNKIVKSALKKDDVLPIRDLFQIQNTHIDGDYSYVVTRPADHIRIVSYKKTGGLIRAISLFSLILTLMGVVLLTGMLFYRFVPYLPNILIPEIEGSESLRYKIQMTIISLIVLSFIIIGIVTSYYFGNVLEQNSTIQNQRETITVLNNIRSAIEGSKSNTESKFIIENRLKEISRNHDITLGLYDRNGEILSKSDGNGLFNRLPFSYVEELNNQQSVTLEVNDKPYDLLPLYNTSEVPFAYIAIMRSAQLTTNSRIIDFLSTILNVYVFLFLTASAFSIAISNSITKPLQILANKLRGFKLGRTTETLEWNSKDEIGALINDYNNLTQKLQESAHIIAKTQRDMAWREMAKQVAHEIKNPLTPMKLSIQYLQSKVQNDPENAHALIDRISATLIEQIDNLNQIANEFSNFAKMPKAKNEKVALNEVVESIHDLFRKREDIDIRLSVPIDGIFVFADRNHVVRILNNIVKNAIQAIPNERRGKIHISLYKEDNNAIIKVKDNGLGIPEEMRSKVFEPNFTTKSSGTGLGLAISANMLESCNGRLYFETVENRGTAFYIEIPMMRLEDNFIGENRVMLD